MGTPRELSFAPQPTASANWRVIASPFQFTTDGSDNLRVVSVNSLAGVRIAIQGRRVTSAGELEPFAFLHTPQSDRMPKTDLFPLGVGALQNVAVFADQGAPVNGQTYVTVSLVRGFSGATLAVGPMLGGYVTATQPLGWPGSPIMSSLDGGGYYRIIIGTLPGAGNQFLETVPTGARWELLSVITDFQTSLAAGNRDVWIVIRSGANAYYSTIHTVAQVGNQDANHVWSAGMAVTQNPRSLIWTYPLPSNLVLSAGDTFASVVLGMQAGDSWNMVQYLVREWLEAR